jgi:hypothetical protein
MNACPTSSTTAQNETDGHETEENWPLTSSEFHALHAPASKIDAAPSNLAAVIQNAEDTHDTDPAMDGPRFGACGISLGLLQAEPL